ncbi:MAG: c-type cytochrome [Pseudomonadota bacterium]
MNWHGVGLLAVVLTISILPIATYAIARSDESRTEAAALAHGARLVNKGRLEDGIVACVACHRASGKGDAGSAFGNLTGLSKAYLAKQLHDYQTGKRENRVMQVIAKNLTKRDIDALATYYAKLKSAHELSKIPEAPPEGVRLAESGDVERGLVACVTCHGKDGRAADDRVPNIFGQHPLYITNQLTAWQSGQRKNDPDSIMAEIAKKLTPLEISAVAIYFARRSRSEN